MLGPSDVLDTLPAHNRAVLTGKFFFSNLISVPFHHGLLIVFATATVMGLPAATASLLRGTPGLAPERKGWRPARRARARAEGLASGEEGSRPSGRAAPGRNG